MPLALKLTAEQFGVVDQPVTLLFGLIEARQIHLAIDLRYQRAALRDRLRGALIYCRKSLSVREIDNNRTSLTTRLDQFNGAVTLCVECVETGEAQMQQTIAMRASARRSAFMSSRTPAYIRWRAPPVVV